LSNGIRIMSERVTYVDSVSVGIWPRPAHVTKTRGRMGISHFTEHMLFRERKRRSARQIADEMDGLGAHLNAFTDKEYTCYYAKFLREHLAKALDVFVGPGARLDIQSG